MRTADARLVAHKPVAGASRRILIERRSQIPRREVVSVSDSVAPDNAHVNCQGRSILRLTREYETA